MAESYDADTKIDALTSEEESLDRKEEEEDEGEEEQEERGLEEAEEGK